MEFLLLEEQFHYFLEALFVDITRIFNLKVLELLYSYVFSFEDIVTETLRHFFLSNSDLDIFELINKKNKSKELNKKIIKELNSHKKLLAVNNSSELQQKFMKTSIIIDSIYFSEKLNILKWLFNEKIIDLDANIFKKLIHKDKLNQLRNIKYGHIKSLEQKIKGFLMIFFIY